MEVIILSKSSLSNVITTSEKINFSLTENDYECKLRLI